MMFDKIKKQKQQKQLRNNLRMFPHLLQQPSSVVLKAYPNILKLNILKILTGLHINYLIFSYIQSLNRANQLNNSMKQSQNNIGIQSIKVGIIGGGVMGRLILNSLLVLQKQGLQPSNITVSTRQTQNLQYYRTQFKVKVQFDNEKLAQQSDILIITVPATLDNWIIAQLRQSLNIRTNKNSSNFTSMNTTVNVIPGNNMGKTSAGVSNPTNKSISANNFNANNASNKCMINPLVYITTSNMNKQKLNKLFSFPILTPFVRGQQLDFLAEVIRQCGVQKITDIWQCTEKIQKFVQDKFLQKSDDVKQILNYVFQRYFYNPDRDRKYTSFNSTQRNYNKQGKTISAKDNIQRQQKIQSNQSSVNNLHELAKNSNNTEPTKNLIDQIMTVNQSIEQTFLVRCRKWRMAYNNFIS